MTELRNSRGVVVLGMDRSGTSATGRMFHRGGFFVGADADMMAGDESNPIGYFENMAVWEVNECLLQDLGYTLNSPFGLERVTPQERHQARLRELLGDLLAIAGSAPLSLKDPRISMLIRVWGPVFDRVLHPILVVRHPVEVACSLARRDGTSIEIGLALWEHRLLLLLESLNGAQISLVPYSRMLEEPSLASEIVAEIVNEKLSDSVHSSVDPARAHGAFESNIRRNRATDRSCRLTDDQMRLWCFLDRLDVGLTTLRVPDRILRATGKA